MTGALMMALGMISVSFGIIVAEGTCFIVPSACVIGGCMLTAIGSRIGGMSFYDGMY